MDFFLTEVTHDGPTIVDHHPGARVWRSAPLGLSLVWLCSLGPWHGAADYPHRAAPHWPTLKGPNRSWSAGRWCHEPREDTRPPPRDRSERTEPVRHASRRRLPMSADATGDRPVQSKVRYGRIAR